LLWLDIKTSACYRLVTDVRNYKMHHINDFNELTLIAYILKYLLVSLNIPIYSRYKTDVVYSILILSYWI